MSKFSITETFTANKIAANFTKLSRKDYFWFLCVGLVSFIIFIRAQEDFSYDYFHYINYFGVLGDFDFKDLVGSIQDSFPLPYIIIPPSGFFEIGFGVFTWMLLQIFGNESFVYALIASFSISARFWILRKMALGWGWAIAINVYAITLFEANAIRLGCSITLFLYGLLFAYQKKSLFSIFFIFSLAGLFHLQIFFAVGLFSFVYLFGKVVVGSKIRLAIYVLMIIVFSIFVRIYTDFLGFGKYVDYLDVESLAGGINIVTSLGLLVVLIFLLKIFLMPRRIFESMISTNETLVWFSAIMVMIPALAIYIFVTNMGALGDRLWQMAFVIFAFNARKIIWKDQLDSIGFIFLALLILVANVNVIYRYPLSNFFYPFSKYIELDPTFLIR